jgi:hypothetical protein
MEGALINPAICHCPVCVYLSPFISLGNFFFTALFFQCLCSLLHINKIFEVGISEHLANKLQHMNIDLVEKVLFSEQGLSVTHSN